MSYIIYTLQDIYFKIMYYCTYFYPFPSISQSVIGEFRTVLFSVVQRDDGGHRNFQAAPF